MVRQRSAVELMTALTVAVLVANCASVATQTTPTFWLRSAPPPSPIPADVQQRAVLYPHGGTPDWASAYGRLERAAFQLKTFRPNL